MVSEGESKQAVRDLVVASLVRIVGRYGKGEKCIEKPDERRHAHLVSVLNLTTQANIEIE